MQEQVPFDILMPPEMAGKAKNMGAVLTGEFIPVGAVFSTTGRQRRPCE